jgi:cytochrome c553
MASSGRCTALPVLGESHRFVRWLWSLYASTAVAIAAASVVAAPPVSAQDAAAGRQKAVQCQACHGLDGFAKIPGAPHLAGQVQEYLVAAMRDYKSGARRNEMMTVAARQLTDDDIEDLAAYYAGLDLKAKAER